MPEIKTIKHSKELFCLIGEYFASAAIRKIFDEPMTSDESYTWFLAIDGDTVQGFAAVRITPKSVGELNYCYVLPEYRGNGIATNLLNHRIEFLKSLGINTAESIIVDARLETFTGLGFEKVGSRGRYIRIRKSL